MFNEILGSLIIGKYPADNKKEICLTEASLVKACGVTHCENLEDYLGVSVTIDDVTYSVTGILNNQYGFCLLSFDPDNKNYGCFAYSEEAIRHIGSTELTEELLIYVDSSKEDEILEQLICTYPADNYISDKFDLVWCKEYNKASFLGTIIPFNAVLTCIFCAVMLLINFFKLKKDCVCLEDYYNYCLNKQSVRNTYMIGNVLFVVLMIGMAILVNGLFSRYAYANWWIVLSAAMLVYVPAEIMCWKGIKND